MYFLTQTMLCAGSGMHRAVGGLRQSDSLRLACTCGAGKERPRAFALLKRRIFSGGSADRAFSRTNRLDDFAERRQRDDVPLAEEEFPLRFLHSSFR